MDLIHMKAGQLKDVKKIKVYVLLERQVVEIALAEYIVQKQVLEMFVNGYKKNETENSVSFSFIIVIFIFMWYN